MYLDRFIENFMCPFGNTAVASSGKVGIIKRVNNTRHIAVVIQTDHPKSVISCCVIFVGV